MKRIYQKEIIDRGYSKPFEIITQESVNVDGRVLKSSKSIEFDPKEYFSQYNAEDFYLENIIAAGAVDGLKECKLYQGRLIAADKAEEAIRDMVFAMDNNNEVKNDD